MTFNLRHSDKTGTQKDSRRTPPKARESRKAQSILRAYVHAPVGLGVQAVTAALWALRPLPSSREAIRLTAKLPAMVQSQVLARFSAYLEAQEGRQGVQGGGEAPKVHKAPQALITPDRPQPRGIFGKHLPALGAFGGKGGAA